MIEHKWVVGPFQCNCRLLACPKTGEAALVDPGDDAEQILRGLERVTISGGIPINVRYLLHTHGHLDHVGATRGVREVLGARTPGGKSPVIALHRGDEPLYQALRRQGAMFGIEYDEPLAVDHYLEHEEELRIGTLKVSIVHTPGHSPGSVCLRVHEDSASGAQETLFTGDTLFQGSVGRTDLWGANGDEMFRNIRERILTLDGDTRVCPGHGADSSIGIEKTQNPFLI